MWLLRRCRRAKRAGVRDGLATSDGPLDLARARLAQAFTQEVLKREGIDAKAIDDADALRYYRQHHEIFSRVESVELAAVVVRSSKLAERLLQRAYGASTQEFTELVNRYSVHKDSKDDHPYEDSSRIRVTGPFTVESLSPHRVLSPEEERPVREFTEEYDAGQFEHSIIENLKKAGVQNTIRSERLLFDILEPYPGRYIQAGGDFTDKEGNVKRVAVAIGPEHGTVGKDLLREAAKEARRGEGFDMLVVCGFAFDPAVPEAAKEYGELTVLPTRMNPDLTMGEELLKKTGSGNLFMVFGEPDLDVEQQDGEITVEIRGLDIYDPTTGEIRSSSTDDIACWFIDTNYNSESFFVRHAYFTGGDKPYEKLKRALKAEIDEAAWESLYSTKSRTFAKPETGHFAVKVINHYGDEVLKVYDV